MADPDPLAAFLAEAARPFVKLVLSKPRAAADDLLRVTVRPLTLRGQTRLSFVYTHRTRDVTKNLAAGEVLAALGTLLGEMFDHAHLHTETEEVQLLTSRKGRRTLLRHRRERVAAAEPDSAVHDRAKRRVVDPDAPFLVALGVTDEAHRVIPAMARKWKQINRFVELLDHALDEAGLSEGSEPVDIVDFGSGKGYLTFASHVHLRAARGAAVRTLGVELRPDLVALCNDAARSVAIDGLRFEQGDVGSVAPEKIDVMIALHACDTATDHAIATGVRAGAAVIMCAPCCHKELRPQLLQPHPLRAILKHGVHLGQQAEMVTDGLRALVLEACGYETRVFEFISLEHTNKNKMILGVKKKKEAARVDSALLWQQVDEIKTYYGVRDQCLATLLAARRATIGAPSLATAPS